MINTLSRQHNWVVTEKKENRTGTAGLLDIAIILAPMVFVITSVCLESINPDYNRISGTISELVWGQQGWLLTTQFFMFGIALMALAGRLYWTFKSSHTFNISVAMLLLIGIGFLVIAVFPTRVPGGGQSTSGLIHLQTVRAISATFPVCCILVGTGLEKKEEFNVCRFCSMAAGVLGLAMIVPGAVASITEAQWLGAIERMILMNGLVWFELVAISLRFPELGARFSHYFANNPVNIKKYINLNA